jgi:hypothetical protein
MNTVTMSSLIYTSYNLYILYIVSKKIIKRVRSKLENNELTIGIEVNPVEWRKQQPSWQRRRLQRR